MTGVVGRQLRGVRDLIFRIGQDIDHDSTLSYENLVEVLFKGRLPDEQDHLGGVNELRHIPRAPMLWEIERSSDRYWRKRSRTQKAGVLSKRRYTLKMEME